MSGFPTRISRTALGPKYLDRRPVVNPQKEIGKAAMNLAFWQVAGVNCVSPMAWVRVNDVGSMTAHAEAWDPNKSTAGPTVTKTATGIYEIEYAASYPDDDGVEVPLSLSSGIVTAQGSAAVFGTVEVVFPNIATVRMFSHAGVATDSAFLVLLY